MGACWSKISVQSRDMNKEYYVEDSSGNRVVPISKFNCGTDSTHVDPETELKEVEDVEIHTQRSRPELRDCKLKAKNVQLESESTANTVKLKAAVKSTDERNDRCAVYDAHHFDDRPMEDFASKINSNISKLEERNQTTTKIGNNDISEISEQQNCKRKENLEKQRDEAAREFQTENEEKMKHGHTKSTTSSAELNSFTADEDVGETVRNCWNIIELGSEFTQSTVRPMESQSSPTGWRVVRLFVSSTFADYHAEREVLVKKVFPELREWCESQHLHFIECDLRWGVPKDSTTEATLRTCLGEIDRCSAETNGMPFFFNMLGERYGWVPLLSQVPEEVVEQYNWIFPCSITHMEILHAAYRTKNPNSFFFVRKADFLANLPSQMETDFVDSEPLAKEQLKILKKKLKEHFADHVFEYSCEYDGIDNSTGRQKVQLKGLEDFCSQALKKLKSAIEKTYPKLDTELSAEETECAMHDSFIQLRGQIVLGRDLEISSLVEFAKTGKFPKQGQNLVNENYPPVVVVGFPAYGKSSIMARCVKEVKKLDCHVFYHFIGSGAGSTDSYVLGCKLYRWLKGCVSSTEQGTRSIEEENLTLDLVVEEIEKLLKELGKKEEQFVIFIDALNQLSDVEDAKHLNWLPASFPGNVRCILSVVKDCRSEDILRGKYSDDPALELPITGLDKRARKEIAVHSLGRFNKKLDEEQLELLVSAPGALNPLWLALACEELRIFGVFEKVTEHITKLPVELKGLLQFILNRLINEDETGNIRKVLCLLVCSVNGLSETELMWLLSDSKEEPLPMMLWANCRRLLKPFLRNTGKLGTEEKLDFFHASIHEVVDEGILQDGAEEQKWRLILAEHFDKICKDELRTTTELPYQLKKAKENKRLLKFLRKDFRGMKMNSMTKNKFYKPMRCKQLTMGNKQFTSEVIICQFCEFGQRDFGQLAGRNVDCCIICGQMVPRKDERSIGKLCQRHKPFTAPGTGKCFVCGKPIHFNTRLKWSKGHLCHFCLAGASNTCVHLDV